METFIILGNYTQQGIDKIKEGPARIESFRRAVAAAGGKLIGWYLTLGRYDFIVIAQGPDSATAAGLILAAGAQGNVRTETVRAFTEEEFKAIVAKLP